MKPNNPNPMIFIYLIYQFWIFNQGTSLASSFTRDLRNLTIIYKPNAFIYHLCQTSHPISFKRIRWHYESLHNETNTYCKQLLNSSDCFDFYYAPSTSLLVVKEPDMFIGKYSCHVNINATYEMKSTGYIDVKLPSNNKRNEDDEHIGMQYSESELGKLANYYNVPFIFDENDLTSFGKRVQLGGIFHTICKSIESSYPISFIWIQLKNTSKGIKTIRFVHNNQHRIIIDNKKSSSSLHIYSVDFSDNGDYVCIASNALGRSFSSTRSLIVSERMVLPRILGNLLNHSYFDLQHNPIKSLTCIADGYPKPNVVWVRVSDSISIVQNQSYAILKFANEMHGLNEYICEARNKHGFTKIFIYVIIPDIHIKPILNYSDVQSRSVVLYWRVLNEHVDRFNHFIIYYRCLQNYDENINEQDDMINIHDYKQVLVDPRTTDYSFTFRMIDLIPFTKYEFRVKAFIGAAPSNYSNSIIIKTLETIPQKIENLHGYVWNETSVVIYWSPPNATNGPNFYYVLYYTINTSIPFDQWSNIIIRTYPFHILSVPIFPNFQLFIRVASVNAKGSILSDFQMINYTLFNTRLLSTIDKFQCFSDDQYQQISLQWSIDHNSRLSIKNYLLYYSDLTQSNNDLIRMFIIPGDSISINRYSSYDLLNYQFNTSLLNLNYNEYHVLRLHLTIIDQNAHQLPMTSSPIYCTFTRKSGKKAKIFVFLARNTDRSIL